MNDPTRIASGFQEEARKKRTRLGREFWDFLKHNKKWWLLPIILLVLLIGLLVLTAGSAGPFIYTLF